MTEADNKPQNEIENNNLQDFQSGRSINLKKIRKFLFLLIALIVINVFVWGTLYTATKSSSNERSITNPSSDSTDSISSSHESFPFEEMTIPYLRSREYNSNLSELTQISSNNDYSTYLTSYDSDGLKVNGLLTIPQGDEPAEGFPAIIFVHGYIPPQNYQTLVNYQSYVDYLAGNGFVVFKIDLRGHGSSEGEPGGGYYSGDYIIDTLNARAALQSSKDPSTGSGRFVDPNRIGLWGHSMAGNVVARALAAQPQIPAIVIWAGAVYTYSDFSEFRIQDSSYQPPSDDSPSRRKRAEMFDLYGEFDSQSEFWKQVPMTNYLDEIRGAISLNHALDDNVVSIDYSRNLNSILNNTSIVHELNEYSSGGHNFTGAAFNQAMQNSVEFFNTHLK